MEAVKFNTNIKCAGCIAKVTPFLNQVEEIEDWRVDTNNPDKILTINTNGEVKLVSFDLGNRFDDEYLVLENMHQFMDKNISIQ